MDIQKVMPLFSLSEQYDKVDKQTLFKHFHDFWPCSLSSFEKTLFEWKALGFIKQIETRGEYTFNKNIIKSFLNQVEFEMLEYFSKHDKDWGSKWLPILKEQLNYLKK